MRRALARRQIARYLSDATSICGRLKAASTEGYGTSRERSGHEALKGLHVAVSLDPLSNSPPLSFTRLYLTSRLVSVASALRDEHHHRIVRSLSLSTLGRKRITLAEGFLGRGRLAPQSVVLQEAAGSLAFPPISDDIKYPVHPESLPGVGIERVLLVALCECWSLESSTSGLSTAGLAQRSHETFAGDSQTPP